MSKQFICYFDGATEPRNPGGNMGMGAIVFLNDESIHHYSGFKKAAPENTNNVAEYLALEHLLDFFEAHIIGNSGQVTKGDEIIITGDSMLVIAQMYQDQRGKTWKIKNGYYLGHAQRCKHKLAQLMASGLKVRFKWVRRNENAKADELSKTELLNHGVEFRLQPLTQDHLK